MSHAERSQRLILDFLQNNQTRPYQIHSFWITNQVYTKNADIQLVLDLTANFDDIISSVDEEKYVQLTDTVPTKTSIKTNDEDLQWNLVRIQALAAWQVLNESGKLPGEGVVVATIDTGVRATHEALAHNFIGDYGWFDPATRTSVPVDSTGHGTQTLGVIAGSKGIGVAPNVKWATCKGCIAFTCSQFDLLNCGEFITCPTLSNGSNHDCSKAPNVVASTWGYGEFFLPVIYAWHAGGIIPVFAIGNGEPECGTAKIDSDVIAVGATTIDDEIAPFSPRGPTRSGAMEPDIVAPGVSVVLAHHLADKAYVTGSGTVLGCSHVAGVIALLQTRNNELSYSEAKDLLLGNTEQDLGFSGQECDGGSDDAFPNHVFGHGRVNAFKCFCSICLAIMHSTNITKREELKWLARWRSWPVK